MELKKLLTLCVVHQHPKVLLGMKKRGLGVGHWNGFGGKVEDDETIEEAAKREMKEESGVEVLDMEKHGIIEYKFEKGSEILEVHIFKVKSFKGELIESEEMSPKWFHIDEIPFNQMWPDDIFWMPLFLKGKKFKGKLLFDKPSDSDYESKTIEQEIEEVDII